MEDVRSSKSRRFASAVAAVALCIGLGAAHAAESSYPAKPVRWIVAFPPGGITDIMTRMLAERLSEKLGQQFIVDNRTGGGGLIAAGMAARAAPDGYTLFTGTISTLAANVSTYRKLPYDPLKDFSPVTVTAVTPYVLVINSGVPAKSVNEFTALAKSKPKQLTFATAGLGGGSHLATELFLSMSGIELIHVPYKGAAPAMVDLLAGQVHMNFNQPPSTLPHVASGRIRVLAASGARRVAMFPDVPTLAEAGVKGYEATSWQGLVVPAGTPTAVIARLHKEVDAVLRSSEMRERLASQGLRGRADYTRRIRKVHRSRDRQMGARGEAGGDQTGITVSPVVIGRLRLQRHLLDDARRQSPLRRSTDPKAEAGQAHNQPERSIPG